MYTLGVLLPSLPKCENSRNAGDFEEKKEKYQFIPNCVGGMVTEDDVHSTACEMFHRNLAIALKGKEVCAAEMLYLAQHGYHAYVKQIGDAYGTEAAKKAALYSTALDDSKSERSEQDVKPTILSMETVGAPVIGVAPPIEPQPTIAEEKTSDPAGSPDKAAQPTPRQVFTIVNGQLAFANPPPHLAAALASSPSQPALPTGVAAATPGGQPVTIARTPEDEDYDWGPFIKAAPPMEETLHDWNISAEINTDLYEEYEPLATPYCGLHCIDLAVGTPDIEVETYQALHPNRGPLYTGTAKFLADYALSRGVNFKLWSRAAGRYVTIGISHHSSAFRTVHVVFRDSQDPRTCVGHYRLLCRKRTSGTNYELPLLDSPQPSASTLLESWLYVQQRKLRLTVLVALIATIKPILLICGYFGVTFGFEFWLYYVLAVCVTALTTFTTITPHYELLSVNGSSGYFTEQSNYDHRAPKDRLVPFKLQDIYAHVVKKMRMYVFTYMVTELTVKKCFVSVLRYVQTWHEVQTLAMRGMSLDLAMVTPGILSMVNTTHKIPDLIANTGEMAAELGRNLRSGAYCPVPVGLVQYNAPSVEAAIPNIGAIRRRQAAGIVGAGCNYVQRYVKMKEVINVPVAVCPIRAPLTAAGVLAPGKITLTDSPGLLAAFCGRSMTALDKVDPVVRRFERFGKTSVKWLVDQCNWAGLVEKPFVEGFREVMRGKRRVDAIDRIAELYNQHVHHYLPPEHEFYSHSGFDKMEATEKKDENGDYRVRPRLIMTMSQLWLVELAQMTPLFHRWNEGLINKFQIKDVEPEEMVRRVVALQRRDHSTTDYSSFEASVDSSIRKIENTAMCRMAQLAGFDATLSRLNKYVWGSRVLKGKGFRFHIATRCSGDYWTSFGNGLTNFMLMAFCIHERTGQDMAAIIGDIQMIAEGDDGLVDASHPDREILEELGFKFSTDISGTWEGQVDFLRSRWVEDKRLLNVGRMMKTFWVMRAARLRRSKQLFLLRCMGNSLYHLSPGHPILSALVERINRETAGFNKFKGFEKYLDKWKGLDTYLDPSPRSVAVREDMRGDIERGAIGFPPLSTAIQLELERRIRDDDQIYFGHIFDAWDDVQSYERSATHLSQSIPTPSPSFQQMCAAVGAEV